MIRILRFLWTGSWHEHVWETLQQVPCIDPSDGRRWTRFYCRCKLRGTHKKFD